MTKEECIRLLEARIANLTGLAQIPQPAHQENDSAIFDIDEISHIQPVNDDDDVNSTMGNHATVLRMPFDFKVPEVPSARLPTYKRQSLRIQQNEQRRSMDRRSSLRYQESADESTIDGDLADRRRSVRSAESAERSTIDTIRTDRRRSVRIQQNAEKRKSIAPKLPSPPAPKRRRTTINKRSRRESTIGTEHSMIILGP